LVDRLLLGRKISEMETYLDQIGEFQKISVASYRTDWKTQRIVERTLQMLIELCIDMANHLISDKEMRMPSNYADAFKVLMENRVIGKFNGWCRVSILQWVSEIWRRDTIEYRSLK